MIKVLYIKLLWIAPLAGFAAALVNSILFYLFLQKGWIDQNILVHRETLEVRHIIIASVAPSLIAGLVYAIIGTISRTPYRVFTYIALPMLVFTFINPFAGIQGVTISMGVVLNIMHIVVAASVLYFFKRYATEAEPGY
jgi:hypothetical protein